MSDAQDATDVRTTSVRNWPKTILTALLLALVAIMMVTGFSSNRARQAQELGTYLLLLLILLSHAPFRRTVFRLDKARLLLLLLLIGSATYAQLRKYMSETYPFVTWDMYSSAQPRTEFIRYDAILQSGKTVRFPFDELAPSRSMRTFAYRFSRQVRLFVNAKDSAQRAGARSQLEQTLANISRVYNQAQPADPIRVAIPLVCPLPLVTDGAGRRPCREVLSVRVE